MNREDETTFLEVKTMVETIGSRRENLVSLLHAIHDRYHYLPAPVLEYLAETTEISPVAIAGVATFYSQFRLEPAGRHCIKICIGTACHVKGAMDLYDDFKKYLDIPPGEDTDRDRLFTVSKVACLGCCMLAPAIQIDTIIYGPVSSPDIPSVLRDFLKSLDTGAAEQTHPAPAGATPGTIKLCTCSSCDAAGSGRVFAAISHILQRERVPACLKNVGCTGMSSRAPLVEIETADGKIFRYGRVTTDDAAAVVFNHFRPAKLLSRLRQRVYSLLEKIHSDEETRNVTRYLPGARDGAPHDYPGRKPQIATENSGQMDPLDYDEYVRRGGFGALKQCLAGNDPDGIIRDIRASGLRGRGGAGFATADKWANVKAAPGVEKYIICNGDEGDPGAFMDRMLLESFPFKVLEGMAIAAFACGIHKGFIYVRSEYPLAVSRITEALRICRVREPDFQLDISVFVSAGAFVCGEETALIASLEGRRGNPHFRPPYPSQEGLWNQPTLVNNVETFALVPWIVRHGAERFATIGTGTSSGTKTFALAGKINNGGLIEVEMGTPVRDIVYSFGGGLQEGRELKAVQIGGPSGGCLPASLIDTPVDFDQLKKLGTIMGSGGLIVLDEEDCMVDVARYFMSFTRDESCGKCTFCRVGTMRMLEMLDDITHGRGTAGTLVQLKELSYQVKQGSLCGLGRAAPNPVLSALAYFEDEFTAHINGTCPAGKCKALITYRITEKCIGCTKCAQRCSRDAIAMNPYNRHEIDQELCVKCDTCRRHCPAEAIVKE